MFLLWLSPTGLSAFIDYVGSPQEAWKRQPPGIFVIIFLGNFCNVEVHWVEGWEEEGEACSQASQPGMHWLPGMSAGNLFQCWVCIWWDGWLAGSIACIMTKSFPCLMGRINSEAAFEETNFSSRVKHHLSWKAVEEHMWYSLQTFPLWPTSAPLSPAAVHPSAGHGAGWGLLWAVRPAARGSWGEVAGVVLCCWGSDISRSHSDFTVVLSSELCFWLSANAAPWKPSLGAQGLVNRCASPWSQHRQNKWEIHLLVQLHFVCISLLKKRSGFLKLRSCGFIGVDLSKSCRYTISTCIFLVRSPKKIFRFLSAPKPNTRSPSQ